jgi:tetratricopeptide (TPR) repeat protein
MRLAIESARRRGLDADQVRSLESYVAVDKASVLVLERRREEALKVLDQALEGAPTALLFEERAELHHYRMNFPGALQDANRALELTHGGWIFSPGRLSRLLMARAWGLYAAGRRSEALADMALALEMAPSDMTLKRVQEYFVQNGEVPSPSK